jgi:NitT/TauT family transport system substrate-binding protein
MCRRRLVGVAGMLALFVAVAGCSSSSSGSAGSGSGSDKANMQLGWIANVENMGPYLALEKGYYTSEGVDLTITPGGPSVTVEPLVVSGKALVGLSSVDIVARAVAQGAPLKIIAATLQQNPTSIMSLAKAPVNTLQDLVGKRLCVQTSGQSVIDAVLKGNGIDPSKVKIVTANFDPAPLVAGDCDAFVSFLNNQPVTLKLQGIDTHTFLLSDYGYHAWSDVLLTTTDALADPAKKATLVKIVRATIKGWQDALADPDAAAKVIVNGPGKSQNLDLAQQKLSAQAFVGLIRTTETAKNGLLSMSQQGIAENIATMQKLGVPGDLASLFDSSVLAQAYGGKTNL